MNYRAWGKGDDIAPVNKFTDLCEAQKTVLETVREHCDALKVKAEACVECEKRCPFGVKVMEHMKNAGNFRSENLVFYDIAPAAGDMLPRYLTAGAIDQNLWQTISL